MITLMEARWQSLPAVVKCAALKSPLAMDNHEQH